MRVILSENPRRQTELKANVSFVRKKKASSIAGCEPEYVVADVDIVKAAAHPALKVISGARTHEGFLTALNIILTEVANAAYKAGHETGKHARSGAPMGW